MWFSPLLLDMDWEWIHPSNTSQPTHTTHSSKKTYITTSSVARHAVREEEAHTVVAENTLLHGETLLIVSSSNATTSTPRRENYTGRRNPWILRRGNHLRLLGRFSYPWKHGYAINTILNATTACFHHRYRKAFENWEQDSKC